MSEPDDELTVAIIRALKDGTAVVHYARCWSCVTMQCPGGWHTWADEEDVEHALANGHPDPSDQICGCECAEGPELHVPEPPDPDEESLNGPECPVCGETGACGYDAEGRPMIHASYDGDDDE